MKRIKSLLALLTAAALLMCTAAVTLCFAADTTSGPQPVKYTEGDGMYTIRFTVTGGDGKETIHTPATLNVDDEKAYAIITWDSATYQTLTLDGKTFKNSGDAENSRFEIPVTTFEEPMTLVMDDGTEYQIQFDRSSISSSMMMGILLIGTFLFIGFILITRLVMYRKYPKKRRR